MLIDALQLLRDINDISYKFKMDNELNNIIWTLLLVELRIYFNF